MKVVYSFKFVIMKNTLIFILALHFFSFEFICQEKNNFTGLLELKKEVTYWDKDNTRKRSEGHIQANGFTGVGDRFGKWKFYYKDGSFEEISNYYAGKYNGQVIQYYPNQKKKFEGYFYLGVPDSISKVYYENGNLAEEGMYNSIPDSIRDTTSKYFKIIPYLPAIKVGEWKTYYEDGKPWEKILYKPNDTVPYLKEFYTKKGLLQVIKGNGTVIEEFASGKPKLEIEYKDGLKNGKFLEWNANGKKNTEGFYKDGLKSGDWIFYYFVSNKIYQKVGYLEDKKHGNFEEYMPNDSLAIKGNYEYGLKNGFWIYNFENGKTDMKGLFKDDLQDGKWEYFYPSGQLYYHGDYESGKKTGDWEFFYNNGQIWRVGAYKNDLKDGVWNVYYENGGDLMQGAYIDGKQHGAWTSWFENGQEKDRGSYDNGKMTAQWTGWFPNGKLNYEGWYENDMKTGNWKFYTSKGKLKDDGNYKIIKTTEEEDLYNLGTEIERSYKHGKWISYSEVDGKLVSEGTYNIGRQSGVWKYYYPGGKVVAQENSYDTNGKLDGVSKSFSRKENQTNEINYKNGLKHGDFKIWDTKGNLIQHLVYKNGVKVKDEITKTVFKYN